LLDRFNGCDFSGFHTGYAVIELIFFTVIFALATYGLARWIVVPMRQLADTVGRFGPNALGLRLRAGGPRDETRQLADNIDAMLDRLAEGYEAQRRFASTASHELRTPLALLQATVELMDEALAAPVPDVDNARRGARTAARQTRRLAGLATDLLDLSRLDGEVALRHEPIDLREIAAAVQAEFEPRAREAGVVLRSANGATPPLIATGDESAVARILGILLDNALRYGADGGAVTTTVEAVDGRAVLRVADRGAGLAPGERARVFGRFERGAAGERTSGFGLGLAIGRELARRMGGELEAVPAERGATFALTLPR